MTSPSLFTLSLVLFTGCAAGPAPIDGGTTHDAALPVDAQVADDHVVVGVRDGGPAVDVDAGPSVCGDARCAPEETCSRCPADCGACFERAFPAASCADDELELPVVTHWSNTVGGFSYLASDQIDLPCTSGVYCDHWPILPNYESYVGQNYSTERVTDAAARDAAGEICERSGRRVRLLRPDALEAGRIESDGDSLQILHARVISGEASADSVATIYLPPGWSDTAPAGSYPLLVAAGYDVNANTFGALGKDIATKVATTPGVIGIFWNGGSSYNGLSMERRMYTQFEDLLDFADRLGGDRHRIHMTGCSRQGQIQLELAGNPHPHDYTVLFASPSCTGIPKFWESSMDWAFGSYPGEMAVTGHVIGLPDAWQQGWRYPERGNGLTGLTARQAVLHILMGVTDLDTANAEHRPFGDRFVDALAAAGTKVVLEIGTHDPFQSVHLQWEYAQKLLAHGVPVEVHYTMFGGHMPFDNMDRAMEAVNATLAGRAIRVAPGVYWFQVAAGTPRVKEPLHPRSGGLPFTLEHASLMYRGRDYPFVVVAEPGTEYAIEISHEGVTHTRFTGTTPPSGFEVRRLPIGSAHGVGDHLVVVQVRYPGELELELLEGTPACAHCRSDIEVRAFEPGWGSTTQVGVVALSTPGMLTQGTFWGVGDVRE